MDPILHACLLPLLASLSPSLAGLRAPAGESLRYAVPDGSVVAKTLFVSHELTLDSVGFSRDGGPVRTTGSTGWISTWIKVSVEDRVLASGEGRPEVFTRTFTDLGGGGELTQNRGRNRPKHEERAVSVSPLRGRSVEFTWVDSEGDWSRLWGREEAEEWWLAGIRGDMDLLALLPSGAVEPGQEWEPPIEAARAVLAAGGNHLITPRTKNVFGRSMEVGVGGDLSEVLGPDLAGRLRARFQGVREDEGLRLAVIELEIQGLHSLADRTDLWRTSMPIEEKQDRMRLLSALLTYSLEARGELLWDLDAGRFHALQLEGDEIFHLAVSKEHAAGGQSSEQSQQSSFSGRLTLEFSVDPPATPADDR